MGASRFRKRRIVKKALRRFSNRRFTRRTIKAVTEPSYWNFTISSSASTILAGYAGLFQEQAQTFNLSELVFKTDNQNFFTRSGPSIYIRGWKIKFRLTNDLIGASTAWPSETRHRFIIYSIPDYKSYLGLPASATQHAIYAGNMGPTNLTSGLPISTLLDGTQGKDFSSGITAMLNRKDVKVYRDFQVKLSPKYGVITGDETPTAAIEIMDKLVKVWLPWNKLFHYKNNWTNTDTNPTDNSQIRGKYMNLYCTIISGGPDLNVTTGTPVGAFTMDGRVYFRRKV